MTGKADTTLLRVGNERLLELILENAPLSINALTTDLRYAVVGAQGLAMMGRPHEEIVGSHCYDLVGQYRDDPTRTGLERACDSCPCLRALATGETAEQVRKWRDNRVVHVTAVPLVDADGDVVGVLELGEDISDKVIDPLTRVHNYRYYDEMIAQEGYRALRYETPLSLLALDLNHFKLVNDTFGHPRGDQVLRDVAQAVLQSVRESDHVCRIGGDEFAVIAPHTTSQEAEALAQRVETAIADEFAVFNITLSVGVASYPKDTTEPAELREIADTRLYELKDGVCCRRGHMF
jgi:diguanylate cyclase (GGDEF)-like protein